MFVIIGEYYLFLVFINYFDHQPLSISLCVTMSMFPPPLTVPFTITRLFFELLHLIYPLIVLCMSKCTSHSRIINSPHVISAFERSPSPTQPNNTHRRSDMN